MKANVQYNDLVGTAAADVADGYANSLQAFMEKSFSSFDEKRYTCRGCSAYIGEGNQVVITFICIDHNTNEFVKFSPEEDWKLDEFFSLFKRFEIVIGQDIAEVIPSDVEINLKGE